MEGVEHCVEEAGLAGSADRGTEPPRRFGCSWKRGQAAFLAARRLGWSKVAFGHRAHDVAQTALLNLLDHARLETMRAKVRFFDGSITLIRPLADVPEKDLVRLAKACGFAL